MRIRSIKPEFWSDPDIGYLPIEDRYLFIGLQSYVSDNGVGLDDERLIRSALLPFDDPHEASLRTHDSLMRLQEAGVIRRYSANGKDYIYVTDWPERQRINRPTRSTFPLPDAEESVPKDHSRPTHESSVSPHDTLTEDSLSPHRRLIPGTREQGNEVTRERGNEVARAERDATDAASGADDDRPDVIAVCDHMADSVKARTGKRPTVTKAWKRTARLMLDKDGHSVDDICAAIDWASNDGFWCSNVLSMNSLRKHYDRMSIQARTRNTTGNAIAQTGPPVEIPTDSETWDRVTKELFTPTAYRDVIGSRE